MHSASLLPPILLRSKASKDADAQVLRACVLLDELITYERPRGAGGPVVVAEVGPVWPLLLHAYHRAEVCTAGAGLAQQGTPASSDVASTAPRSLKGCSRSAHWFLTPLLFF